MRQRNTKSSNKNGGNENERIRHYFRIWDLRGWFYEKVTSQVSKKKGIRGKQFDGSTSREKKE